MATLDYIDVPASATRLRPQSPKNGHQIRRAPKIVTTLPHPPPPIPIHRRTDSASSITSPTKTAVNLLPQLLLSSLPSGTPQQQGPSNPRAKQQSNTLLSSRDPLSVPILTVNFKRFIERVGPIFWLQDRIEEIVLWKRGWKVTSVWIAAYAFFCYFPRMLFLLPQIGLISIILATHPETTHKPPAPEAPAETGSVDWQANIQAIQNLMGLVADAETALQPYIPYLTHRKAQTPHLLTLLLMSLLPMSALVSLPMFPMRSVCLFLGIAPLLLTHPTVRALLPSLAALAASHADASPLLAKLRAKVCGTSSPRSWRSVATRLIDDANLTDECWVAQMREVELFENERFAATDDATQQEWSKAHLRDGERTGWTRGRDGWSGVGGQGGVSSNLTFSLDVGWAFVDTEDWRADLEARWAGAAPRVENGEAGSAVGDEDGWVYTNDAWTAHRPPSASYSPSVGGVTRRRRWVRRIWYDHTRAISMS